VLFTIGMSLLVLHEHIPDSRMAGSVSFIGGALIGAAHFRNMQFLCKCRCCETAPGSK
jgi:hypothetical protein